MTEPIHWGRHGDDLVIYRGPEELARIPASKLPALILAAAKVLRG